MKVKKMKLSEYRNKPQDIKTSFNTKEYEKIERIFYELEFHELALLLSLIGFHYKERIDLQKSDGGKDHIFSRTNYSKSENEFDAYFALITILENYKKKFSDVVNNLAFVKTESERTTFSKLGNVKLFFEYILGGSGKLNNIITKYGDEPRDMINAIDDFLNEDIKETDSVIEEINADYLLENE
jgi:hypothetical protein